MPTYISDEDTEPGMIADSYNSRKLRQEDCHKFTASLRYMVSTRPTRATQQAYLKNK